MPSRSAAPHTLAELALALGADLVGDGTTAVITLAHPLLAEGPDTLALATQPQAELALAHTRAISAVVAEGRAGALASLQGGIVVSRPRYALARLLEIFAVPPVIESGVHPSAIVHATASIGTGVSIGPGVHVGPGALVGDRTRVLSQVTIGADVTIGDDCLIHAGVRIGDRSVLGHRLILHANAVIGSDGFGFVTPETGSVESAKATGRVEASNVALVRVNSIGIVVIGDDVEIGAGTCVDRGTLGVTRIGRGTKIDNLVQIAHGVVLGRNVLLAAQVGIAGSTVIGDSVMFGGQVGVGGHLSIGDRVKAVGQSGITNSVDADQFVSGYPAIPNSEWRRSSAVFRKLPEMRRQLKALEARLRQIEETDN